MRSLRGVRKGSALRALAGVFAISWAVRLALFTFVLIQIDEDQLRQATPDVANYFAASDAILDLDLLDPSLSSFGPGQPVYIAFLRTVFVDDARFMLAFNLLIGAIGSFLLGFLAWRLTDDARAAWLAGLIHALSPSAISLSLILLSDTLYFTLVAGGLLLFVQALKSEQKWIFLLCGIWFGLTPLIRSIGVFLPLLLPVIGWLLLRRHRLDSFRPMWHRIAWPVLTALISFALLWCYTLRPRTPEDPPISFPAYSGMMKLASKIHARVDGIGYDSAWARACRRADSVQGARQCGPMEAYMAQSISEFRGCVKSYPLKSAQVMFNNTWSNANDEHIIIGASLPRWQPSYREYERWAERNFVHYRHLAFMLLGLVMLGIHRRWDVLWTALIIYAYFLVTSAMTLEWGNRTFHPGLIGWAIPAGYALSMLVGCLRKQRLDTA